MPVSPVAAASLPPPRRRASAFTRSPIGLLGLIFLALVFVACVATLPYTLGRVPLRQSAAAPHDPSPLGPPRYDNQDSLARHLPPSWWGAGPLTDPDADSAAKRLRDLTERRALEAIAAARATTVADLRAQGVTPTPEQLAAAEPFYLMGTDVLGRDLFIRVLAGGGISLTIGLCAAALSVFVGAFYGAIAGAVGGRTDAVMMRIVDILYGLPYILLVVLLAVASDAVIDEYVGRAKARARWIEQTSHQLAREHLGVAQLSDERLEAYLAAAPQGPAITSLTRSVLHEHWEWTRRRAQRDPSLPEPAPSPPTDADAARFLAERATVRQALTDLGSLAVRPRTMRPSTRTALDLVTLLVAIGGVSWLTMARVVRGQVLSLKRQPFMEAARALGVPVHRQFFRHLLPNLLGPIIVYATLTVPQAILQESFLSFLGIGVRPPLPSWGNLAAEGLTELNPYKSNWWLLLFPCLMLGLTLLALNFVGEGLREAFDPKRARR